MPHEPKQCQTCPKKIRHGHILRHTKACEAKWLKNRNKHKDECLYCKREFKKRGDLRRHIRSDACGWRAYAKLRDSGADMTDVKKPAPSKFARKRRELGKLTTSPAHRFCEELTDPGSR